MANKVIYALVNADAGLFYVGQTVDLHRRLVAHQRFGEGYDHLPIKQAFLEHGFASFECKVLEEVDAADARIAEARWIERMATEFVGWTSLNKDRPQRVMPKQKFLKPRPKKLTAKIVAEIRQLLRDGTLKQRQIAQLYGIAQPTISHIKNGNHSLIGAE